MAPRFGVLPTITDAAVSDATLELAQGNRCISVGHKTHISGSILLALRQAGVRYVSTRSVGYNHIDVECAESVGISVETVAYSPDSVADYTLMLMLMTVRHAKSTISRAVTSLLERGAIERVENEDDRREFNLRLTRKGRKLYEELFPRLLRKEQDILACLTAAERKDFAALLGKIERSLALVQTSAEADAKQAY